MNNGICTLNQWGDAWAKNIGYHRGKLTWHNIDANNLIRRSKLLGDESTNSTTGPCNQYFLQEVSAY
jgi:hypothetical protein